MSATLINTARGGVIGQDVSPYNAGEVSGDPWAGIFMSTNATITYAEAPQRGGTAYKFSTGATGAQAYLSWNTMPQQSTYYIRFYAYPDGLPGASIRFFELLDSTTTPCCTFGVRTTGQMTLRDSQGGIIWDSKLYLRPREWARIELKIDISQTVGQVEARIYTEADSPYPAERLISAATFNTMPNGTVPTNMRFGLPSLPTTNYTAYVNQMAASDTNWLGPADWSVDAPLVARNDAEVGPSGAVVTSQNSGDDQNHFLQFINSSVGASTYSTTQAAHGNQSFYIQPVNGDAHSYALTNLATTRAAARMYIRLTAAPTVGIDALQFTTPLYGTFSLLSRCIIGSFAECKIMDPAGTTLWTSSSSLPLNTWIRLEMFTQIGTTGTDCTIQFAYYTGDSTTATESFSTTTANLGTLPIGMVRFGKINNNTWTTPFYLDCLAVEQRASGFIGPYTTPPAIAATYAGVIPHAGWGIRV